MSLPSHSAIIAALTLSLDRVDHPLALAASTDVTAAQARYQIAGTPAHRAALSTALHNAEALLICLAAAGWQSATIIAPIHRVGM